MDDPAAPAAAPARALGLDADNPWPGLAAYDESARGYFKGRDAEAAELLRLVQQTAQTALYGKSGLGKSSLLQAGLFPLLRQAHFLPVLLRLDVSAGALRPPMEQVMQGLIEALRAEGADFTPPEPGETAWHYLHRRDLELWSHDNFPLTPVLVLDQFEELFAPRPAGAPTVESVMNALGDLIESRVSDEFTGADRQALARLDTQSLRYRVLLSFREDYLPAIKGWEKKIPSLLRNFLHLQPMAREQAVRAVAEPGARVLAPGVAERIVDFVGNLDDEVGPTADDRIEPVLLSLCCHQLNARRDPGGLIDAALLKKVGQDILEDFYRRALDGMPPSVSTFIEDHLVQGNRYRSSYAADLALQEGLLTAAQLALLTDKHRLLRVDPQSGVNRIELIHDRLVGVVVRARDRRHALEQEARERRLQDEAQAQAEARRLRKSRNQMRGAVVGLALLAAATVWQALRANSEAAYAQKKADEAVDSAAKATKAREAADKARQEALELADYARAQSKRAEEALGVAEVQRKEAERLRGAADNDRQRAVTAERRAKEFGRSATALRLSTEATMALASDQPSSPSTDELSLLKLVAAYRLAPADATVAARVLAQMNQLVPLLRLVPAGGEVGAVAFSPDGRRLVAAGADRALSLRDAASLEPVGVPLRGHAATVMAVAYSPDGRRIASADADGQIRLWDAGSGAPVGPLMQVGDGQLVRAIAFTPDGRWLLSGDNGGMLRWWDAADGRALRSVKAHKEWVNGLAVSRDGRLVATASQDHSWRLFEAATGTPVGAAVKRLDDPLNCAAFSADGTELISGGDDGMIRHWTVASREPVGEPIDTTREGAAKSGVLALGFSRDGKWFASSSANGAVQVWDAESHNLAQDLRGHDGEVAGLAFSPDGRRLATGSGDGTLRLWRLGGAGEWGEPMRRLPTRAPSSRGLAMHHDGRSLRVLTQDLNLLSWDATTAEATGHSAQFRRNAAIAAAFSRDGSRYVVATDGPVLAQWSVQDRTAIQSDLAGPTGKTVPLAYAPDGARFAAGGDDGVLRIWDAASGRIAASSPPAGAAIGALAYGPAGRTLTAGLANGGLQRFDAATAQPIGVAQPAHGASVQVLAISPDGSHLATADLRGSMRLWRRGDGPWLPLAELRVAGMPAVAATALAFSPDGSRLASGGANGSLRVWQSSDGTPMGPAVQAHNGEIAALVFDPAGHVIVSSGGDRSIRRWPLPERWPTLLCGKLSQDLGPARFGEMVASDLAYVRACPELPEPAPEVPAAAARR